MLCADVVRRGVSDHRALPRPWSCTVNARRPTVDSRFRGTTIICCVADLRRCLHCNNIGDRCATVDKVLRSLARPTSVHDDTKLIIIGLNEANNRTIDLK